MKNILINSLLFFSMLLSWANASLAAVDSAEAAQKLVEIIKANADSSEMPDLSLCQESGSKKTLRMESGKYCSDPLFGNFALLMCDDFLNYTFDKVSIAKMKRQLSDRRCSFMQSKCMKVIDGAGNIFPFEYKTIIAQLKNLIARISNPENREIICRAIPPLPAYESICSGQRS